MRTWLNSLTRRTICFSKPAEIHNRVIVEFISMNLSAIMKHCRFLSFKLSR
ncbi:IS1 family transposase [Endozoicomonas sp. ONNA1]|uniref:IS1 family transposase n=1 Tax=unclassified Endozoicomonas TaxID=2644528 RepID=UPI0034D35E1D